MLSQGTAKFVAQVSVCCEMCGNCYSYDHKLSSIQQHGNKSAAMEAARWQLGKKVDKITAGDYGLIAEHKPCPKCGYVQSWMILPVRKRRGDDWGAALGIASSLLYFLVVILIMSLLANTSPHNDIFKNDTLGYFMFCGMPVIVCVIVYFVGRALVMQLYQPNRGREIPKQTKMPNVTFKTPS